MPNPGFGGFPTIPSANGSNALAPVANHANNNADNRGRTSTTPLNEQELRNLTTLVEQAVGFDRERGDSVRVISAPFIAPPKEAEESLPLWRQPWVIDTLRAAAMPAALAFVALLIVMTTIRPALKSLLAPPAPPEPGSTVNAVLDQTRLLPGSMPNEPGSCRYSASASFPICRIMRK